MARILYVAKLAVDKDSGMALPQLRGQGGTIIARGNPAVVPQISEDRAGTTLIPGSTLTVNEYGFVPSFWVDEVDLPVSWWGAGVEVPLESTEGIAKRLEEVNRVSEDAAENSVPRVGSGPVRIHPPSTSLPASPQVGDIAFLIPS